MRVALFEPDWKSPISMLIAIITKTPWTHAAFEIDGKWYDASESRGDFNEVDIKKSMRGRLAHVWRLGNRLAVRNLIEDHKGEPYDYKGVLGYIWKKGNDRRFYCFEAVMAASLLVKQPDVLPNLKRVNGLDILNLLGTPNEIKRF